MSIRFGADTPRGGLRPYDQVLRITLYQVDATAAQIFPGDVVERLATGGVALTTTMGAGVFPLGVSAEWTTASQASATLLVYDHPLQLFSIQEDSDTSFATLPQINLNYDMVYTAGTTVAGPQSQREIDISSGVVSTTAVGLRMIKIHEGEVGVGAAGSTIGDQHYATAAAEQKKVVVQFINHSYIQPTTV